MEESRQVCDGCRWLGSLYCWHPVWDDHDDLVTMDGRLAGNRMFKPVERDEGSPAWCPGKKEVK